MTDPNRDLDALRMRLQAGEIPVSLGDVPDRAARSLALAGVVGAPLVASLDVAAAAEADETARRRAVEVATAQARTVAAGLLTAPAVLLPLLSRLLAIDLVAFYLTPVGTVVGAAAGLLVAAGALLIRRILRRLGSPTRTSPVAAALLAGALGALLVGPHLGTAAGVCTWFVRSRRDPEALPPDGADEAVDLVATALAGGAGPAEACRAAADRLPSFAPALRRTACRLDLGLDLDRAASPPPPGIDRLGALLRTSQLAGAPAVPALRRLASEIRADAQARALAEAERLPVRLTFPLTLFLLPGILVLVGAPLIASGLAEAGLTP